MLAWLITSSLALAGLDGSAQGVELPPSVRAAVEAAAPDELVDRLLAIGAPALSAAWAVELGLVVDPRGPHAADARDVWPVLLDRAEVASLVSSLESVIPDDSGYDVVYLAVRRLAERRDPRVARVIAELLGRLPAESFRSHRTTEWITASLVAYARGRVDIRGALESNHDRFPAALGASVELALIASGSSAPLDSWREDTLPTIELDRRLRGLRHLPVGFAVTRDVISAVEDLMDHPDGTVRARAAQSVTTLGATELIPDLIRLIEDRDPRVSRAASASLVELGGVRWPRSGEDWEAWWNDEERWIERELPDLLDELIRPRPGGRVRALRLILEHPGAAHAAAAGVGSACATGTDEAFCLRLIECLDVLRGPDASETLRRASTDPRPALRSAARALLEAR